MAVKFFWQKVLKMFGLGVSDTLAVSSDEGTIKLGKKSYKLEDISRIDIRHTFEDNEKEIVEVVVSSTDRTKSTLFSGLARHVEKICKLEADNEAIEKIKTIANQNHLNLRIL